MAVVVALGDAMRNNRVLSFWKHEPVLLIALVLAVVSSFFVPFSMSALIHAVDWKVLGCLASLMLVVAGLRKQGVFARLADALLRKVHGVRGIGFSLVFLTFFLSMAITNDVALITFVPFTMAVYVSNGTPRAILPVVVLQTVAANVGSALTPVGNPQNLYIYSRYRFSAGTFFTTMLPFVLVGAVLLAICLWVMLHGRKDTIGASSVNENPVPNGLNALNNVPTQSPEAFSVVAVVRYCVLFIVALCAVFPVVPWYVAVCVVAVAMLPDHELFAKIDWSLLLTFIGFFVFIGNLSSMEDLAAWFGRLLEGHVFETSLLASQIISNVPATLLLSRFTEDGIQLLLGVNAGGCGTLIASLASVISYKYYAGFHVGHADLVPGVGRYMVVFTVVNLLFIAVLWGCQVVIW